MLRNLIDTVQANMSAFRANDDGVYGILAEFRHPGALYQAAKEVRKAGYKRYDAHSPFPIHGMDAAMGLGNSRIGYLTFIGGLTGLALATWLQWWTSAIDYPLNISGKPLFAIEPSVPIMFELTILFAAFATVAGMLAFNGLPRPYNPLFSSDRFAKVTDDGFFIHVAASDAQFDAEKTAAFLRSLGATHIETVRDTGDSMLTESGDSASADADRIVVEVVDDPARDDVPPATPRA
jgi:hypothetical protein